MPKQYRNVTRDGDHVKGERTLGEESWIGFEAYWPLLRISEACDRGALRQIMDEADGYGEPGFFPGGYDWSGIRDSTPEATARMDEVAKAYVSDDDLNRMLGLSEAG